MSLSIPPPPRRATWVLLLPCWIAGLAVAAEPVASRQGIPGSPAVPGIVVLIDSLELPARIDGVLVSVAVRVGDRVTAGQNVGQIAGATGPSDLAVARAQSATAAFEAQDEVQIAYADKAIAVAEAKLIRYLQANRGAARTYTQTEIDEQQLEIQRLRASRQLALRDQSLARLRYDETVAQTGRVASQIDRGDLTSPIDGTVLDDPPAVGTWLRTGQSVTRIGNLGRLRVQAFVPASGGANVAIGQRARVHVGDRDEPIEATVRHVGLMVDRVNGDVEIWVDFDNLDPPIRPGTAVEVVLDLK